MKTELSNFRNASFQRGFHFTPPAIIPGSRAIWPLRVSRFSGALSILDETLLTEYLDLHRVAHSGPMVEYAGSTTAAASDCQSEVLAPNTSPMGPLFWFSTGPTVD